MLKRDIPFGTNFGNWYVLGRDFSKGDRRKYYVCHCICGKLKSVISHSLYNGDSTSCGCQYAAGLPRARKSSYEDRALTHIMNGYKAHTIQRGQEFTIDRATFLRLIKKDCYWCGSKPNNKLKGSVIFHLKGQDHSDYEFLYNGLDRIDNTKGYTEDNVNPCCYVCNRARNNMLFEEFKAWLDDLTAFRSATD